MCGGVLHHLADPGAGLRALSAALKPDGAMFLMLYGRAARAGVYLMQDVFRRLGVRQDAAGVAFVRQALADLPPTHYARHFIANSASFDDDAELVDTYLHPQDRAYSVAEVLDFVRHNGLVFRAWTVATASTRRCAAARHRAGARGARARNRGPVEHRGSGDAHGPQARLSRLPAGA